MRNILIMTLILLASCTATTTGGDTDFTESEIRARMDRIGDRYAWYCGSEGVSFRAVVRVTATVVATVASLGQVPDLCSGYNSARAEAIKMIEAERSALESGLLDLQTTEEVN